MVQIEGNGRQELESAGSQVLGTVGNSQMLGTKHQGQGSEWGHTPLVLLEIRLDGFVGGSQRNSQSETEESNWIKDKVQGQVIIGVNG